MNQHTTVCKVCPFNRNVEPGALGDSSPETYIGQAHGPFFLPCHSGEGYLGIECGVNTGKHAHCVGAAKFRANTDRAKLMPPTLLRADADKETVFANEAEFLAHHHEITVEDAENFLAIVSPQRMMQIAMSRLTAKQIQKV